MSCYFYLNMQSFFDTSSQNKYWYTYIDRYIYTISICIWPKRKKKLYLVLFLVFSNEDIRFKCCFWLMNDLNFINFVAFSEYMNFMKNHSKYNSKLQLYLIWFLINQTLCFNRSRHLTVSITLAVQGISTVRMPV